MFESSVSNACSALNGARETVQRTDYSSRVLKKASCRLLKKIQMRGARKIDERRRTYSRCSEAIERQRSIWVFFSSLLGPGAVDVGRSDSDPIFNLDRCRLISKQLPHQTGLQKPVISIEQIFIGAAIFLFGHPREQISEKYGIPHCYFFFLSGCWPPVRQSSRVATYCWFC